MWQDLGAALCLVLVIEGLLPFLSPATWRSLLARTASIDDASVRLTGLGSMALGAGLLYLVR